jgi:hypothetical protein
MKIKSILLLIALAIAANASYSQKGLEGIIVEKYYISNENDSKEPNGGKLPVGSTTYRIFVDLKPGYSLQSVFGVEHELKIATTTKFFNNEVRGQIFPTFPKSALSQGTVMLDSWLSFGGACKDHLGVLKSKDNGVATVVKNDDFLKNTDPLMGLALSIQDGMIMRPTLTPSQAGFVGELAVLDASNDGPMGDSISSGEKGAGWFSSGGGAVGADSIDNMVLIAQLTTDGILTFDLNVQIGTPVPGKTQTYYYKKINPDDVVEPTLSYNSSKINVGIKENEIKESAINIYPNPANDIIYLDISDNYTGKYELYDMTGEKVLQGEIENENRPAIDISSIPIGMYTVKVEVNGLRSFNKIVKF